METVDIIKYLRNAIAFYDNNSPNADPVDYDEAWDYLDDLEKTL